MNFSHLLGILKIMGGAVLVVPQCVVASALVAQFAWFTTTLQ
jgi:hypothetical protein